MPAPLTITNTDRTSEELLEFALNCKDHRQRRRTRAIAFRLDGMSPGDVAARLGTTVQSVRDWTFRYNRAGLEGLADGPRTGRPGCLDAGQRTLLGERVKAGPGPEDGGLVRWRLRDLVAWATARFGVSVSLAAMHRTLRALGFSHQTVRPVHPKADPERQRDFCNDFSRLALDAAGGKDREEPGKGPEPPQVEIWFQDELRAGRKGTNTRVWARRGVRPRAVRDHRYGYRYLFAASRADDPCAVGHVCEKANTCEMNVHLEMISAKVKPGNHAVVVLDGAGWHRSKALERPANVSLLHLPPYSPELNPVEQVFDYLRSNFLSNRLFPKVEDVQAAMQDAWMAFETDLERIASVTKRSWARVQDNSSPEGAL